MADKDAAITTVAIDRASEFADCRRRLQPARRLRVEYSELLDFCSARMPYFCVPRYLEVLDEIPKNVIGRVRKDVLRSRGLGVGSWDREAHGYMLSR